jgi:hypothetical protein
VERLVSSLGWQLGLMAIVALGFTHSARAIDADVQALFPGFFS